MSIRPPSLVGVVLTAAIFLSVFGCDPLVGPLFDDYPLLWFKHDAVVVRPDASVQLAVMSRASEDDLTVAVTAGAWTVSDGSVGTVDGDGVFVGNSAGIARVTYESGGNRTTGTVEVRAGAMSGEVRWRAVDVEDGGACALDVDDRTYCWGEDYWGEVPDGQRRTWTLAHSPRPIEAMASSLAVGSDHGCLLREGHPHCWGHYIVVNRNSSEQHLLAPTPVPLAPQLRNLTAGHSHVCGVSEAGPAYCWGMDGRGELGAGAGTAGQGRATPTLVAGDLSFQTLVGGLFRTCGLTTAGRAYCWGSGGQGRLGNGQTSGAAAPVEVATDQTFIQLAGEHHSCGLTAAGELYCWGPNYYRAIGAFQEEIIDFPVRLDHGRVYTDVYASNATTCALTADGTAYCWGSNREGNLGRGVLETGELCGQQPCSAEPLEVAGEIRFAMLSVGEHNVCGVSLDQRLYCWGSNDRGQLGSGQPLELSTVPVEVVDPIFD